MTEPVMWDEVIDTKMIEPSGEALTEQQLGSTLGSAPKQGYGLASPPAVRSASEKFERTYSAMLRLLAAS